MRTHTLKCWPSMFDAIERGEKTAEFRRNDRDFAVGDAVLLRYWDPTPYTLGNPHGYASPDRAIRATITHVVNGGQFGIPSGYCMFSFRVAQSVPQQPEAPPPTDEMSARPAALFQSRT